MAETTLLDPCTELNLIHGGRSNPGDARPTVGRQVDRSTCRIGRAGGSARAGVHHPIEVGQVQVTAGLTNE
jgi:hypothetical protein